MPPRRHNGPARLDTDGKNPGTGNGQRPSPVSTSNSRVSAARDLSIFFDARNSVRRPQQIAVRLPRQENVRSANASGLFTFARRHRLYSAPRIPPIDANFRLRCLWRLNGYASRDLFIRHAPPACLFLCHHPGSCATDFLLIRDFEHRSSTASKILKIAGARTDFRDRFFAI